MRPSWIVPASFAVAATRSSRRLLLLQGDSEHSSPPHDSIDTMETTATDRHGRLHMPEPSSSSPSDGLQQCAPVSPLSMPTHCMDPSLSPFPVPSTASTQHSASPLLLSSSMTSTPHSARLQAYEQQQRRDAVMIVESDPSPDWQPQLVGGFDCQWIDDRRCVASLVVLSLPQLAVVSRLSLRLQGTEDVPYVSGALGLREVPACLQLLKLVPHRCRPQLLMVDGGGRLHQRRCGSASAIGLAADLPTLGVSKSLLRHVLIDDPTEAEVRQQLAASGSHRLTLSAADGPIAVAVCSASAPSPVYVSVGHLISLQTAASLAQRCQTFRVPEPIRQADITSRSEARRWLREAAATTAGKEETEATAATAAARGEAAKQADAAEVGDFGSSR